MKFLQGEKIKLRAVEPGDINLLLEWENDTSLWEISGTLSPFSRSVLKQYIKNAHLDIYQTRQLRFMIELSGERTTVGTVDLFDFDPFHHRAGVGILLAEPAQRNNGYASEALSLVKNYAFGYLGLHQMFCNILEDNKPSLRLFQKAGFSISGKKRAWIRVGAAYKDQHFLQVFRDE